MKPYGKSLLCALLVLVISIIFTAWGVSYWQTRGTITIKNQSNHTINNIYAVYVQNGVEQKAWIGTLPANTDYQYRINYGNINEGSMYITYQDESQKNHQFDVAGYIAEYNKERYFVTIQ